MCLWEKSLDAWLCSVCVEEVGRWNIWATLSDFGTSAQSRQNLHCSFIQAVSQEEPSDRKPDPWPIWMAGHAQLKFVMTECSKTQIRLTRHISKCPIQTQIEIHSKLSALYPKQHFLHYKSRENFGCNRKKVWIQLDQNTMLLSPSPWTLHTKFEQKWQPGIRHLP